MPSDKQVIRFGPFVADVRTGELRKHNRRIRVPHQSFTALAALAERAGQLVTREELCARLWPDGTFVEYEQGLNAVINRLREALGDSAADPRFIETLPRRGYRFIAPLESIVVEPVAAIDQPPSVSDSRGQRWRLAGVATAIGGALLVGGLVVWVAGRKATDSVSMGLRVTPFTSLVGEENAPAFSPDGSQIAFAWNGDPDNRQLFDLYVKSVGAERTLRLTSHPSRWISAAWSPDGARIAFARGADDASGIFLIPALGGPEQRLATASFSSQTFMQINWSPDGKTLSYSSLDSTGSNVVHLLSLDNLNVTPLPSAPSCRDAGAPAFSPDGTRLAILCTSSVAVFGIYVCPLDGGPAQLIGSMMGHPLGLAWLRDGTGLMVAIDSGEGGSLWQLSLDGTLARLPFGEQGSAPAVAGTGAVAYARRNEDTNIWRIDLKVPRPEESARPLLVSTRLDMTPQFSPDGSRIAFQSNRSGTPEIWVAETDGSSPVRLTSANGALTGAPSWCADGSRIAFDSRATGASAIYIAHVGQGLPRRLETDRPNLSLPAWSQDCQWILASDGKNELFRLPAAGGPAVRFTMQPAYYAQVTGDRVVFNVKVASGVTLWSKSIDGGREHSLPGMPVLAYSDPWTVSPTGVYFVRSPSIGRAGLEFYAFETQTVRSIGQFSRPPTPLGGLGLAVSSDERWLVYTQTDGVEADIMLASPP